MIKRNIRWSFEGCKQTFEGYKMTFVYALIGIQTHMHTHTHTHIHTYTHIYAHTYTQSHTHARMQAHARTHTHTHTESHTRSHTHTHAHTRTHTHTYAHTLHTHTHTHTQLTKNVWSQQTLSALDATAATCLPRSQPARWNTFWHNGSSFAAMNITQNHNVRSLYYKTHSSLSAKCFVKPAINSFLKFL